MDSHVNVVLLLCDTAVAHQLGLFDAVYHVYAQDYMNDRDSPKSDQV